MKNLLRRLCLVQAVLTVASYAALSVTKVEPPIRRISDNAPRLPGQTWRIHDAEPPHPKKVAPGPLVSAPPPSDAVILFDGEDLSHWVTAGCGGQILEPKWKVEGGYMEIVPRSRRLVHRDCARIDASMNNYRD
jgi:hypothetical protein